MRHSRGRVSPVDADLQQLTTVGDLVRWGASRLNGAGRHFGHGTDNAADEARVLVFHALALDFDSPAYFYRARVTASEREQVIALLNKRAESGEPAAYLTGEAWFAGLRFSVDRSVLVPRSPIAELILRGFEPWVPDAGIQQALDIGTGSGCIAIALAAHMGCRVDATDISTQALSVAARNVAAHALQDRVQLIRSDVYSELGGRRYDLIVSNPPYVPPSSYASLPDEYGYEPQQALLAEDDGLAVVTRVIRGAADHLQTGGLLVCEVGENATALLARFPALPFEWIEFEHGGDGVFVLREQDLAQEKFDVG